MLSKIMYIELKVHTQIHSASLVRICLILINPTSLIPYTFIVTIVCSYNAGSVYLFINYFVSVKTNTN